MRCVACSAEVPDDLPQCPHCREHMDFWRKLNSHAQGCRQAADHYIRCGNPAQTLLRLVHASILQPNDSTTLAALGALLLEQGDAEDALWYLRKAVLVCASQGQKPPADWTALQQRAEAALAQGPDLPPSAAPATPAACAVPDAAEGVATPDEPARPAAAPDAAAPAA